MQNSAKLIFAVFLCSGLLVFGPTLAQADIMFLEGNHPQPDEQNILLNTGTSGSIVFGETNQTHTIVQFSSSQDTLFEPAKGQAVIDASPEGALLHDITITVPGATFGDFILNPICPTGIGTGNCGVATVTVTDTTNHTFTYTLGNGNNFLTIVAVDGQRISSVNIHDPTGFDELKQPRISGIPEPSTLILLGSVLVGFVVARRKMKRS